MTAYFIPTGLVTAAYIGVLGGQLVFSAPAVGGDDRPQIGMVTPRIIIPEEEEELLLGIESPSTASAAKQHAGIPPAPEDTNRGYLPTSVTVTDLGGGSEHAAATCPQPTLQWAAPSPCAIATALSETVHDEQTDSEKVKHLRRAAHHLRAAGKAELARTIGRDAMVEEKLDQIRKLQREVEALRATPAIDQAVALQVRIIEAQVGRMRKLGLSFESFEGVCVNHVTGDTLAKLGAIDGLMTALREKGLIKVLAEPTLITVSGRPATFQVGREFPILAPTSSDKQPARCQQFVGTRLDCISNVLDNGRIRVELRPTVTQIDNSRCVSTQGTGGPGVRSYSLDTSVELEPGQTVVLSGMNRMCPNSTGDAAEVEETAILVTLKADLAEPAAQVQQPVVPTRR